MAIRWNLMQPPAFVAHQPRSAQKTIKAERKWLRRKCFGNPIIADFVRRVLNHQLLRPTPQASGELPNSRLDNPTNHPA